MTTLEMLHEMKDILNRVCLLVYGETPIRYVANSKSLISNDYYNWKILRKTITNSGYPNAHPEYNSMLLYRDPSGDTFHFESFNHITRENLRKIVIDIAELMFDFNKDFSYYEKIPNMHKVLIELNKYSDEELRLYFKLT